MLDFKINYILNEEDNIFEKLLTKYDKNLSLYGKQDGTLGIYIKMLMYSLRLNFLGENTRLELYKKLLAMLRKNGLIYRIPEPDLPTASYPYYYGAEASSATPTEIQALSMDLSAKEDKSYSFTLTAKVYYVAYPAYYGNLTSILDNNEFETLPGWLTRTEMFTVGADEVSYLIYEFRHITTQVGFTNTFKH